MKTIFEQLKGADALQETHLDCVGKYTGLRSIGFLARNLKTYDPMEQNAAAQEELQRERRALSLYELGRPVVVGRRNISNSYLPRQRQSGKMRLAHASSGFLKGKMRLAHASSGFLKGKMRLAYASGGFLKPRTE